MLNMQKEAQELVEEILAKCDGDTEERAVAYARKVLEETYDAGFSEGLMAGRGGE